MSKAIATLLAVALAALGAAGAQAQKAPGTLESRLVARKVVVADGRESLVDAADAKPGDVIEYVATYRNTGTAAIRDLEATLPIPRDTEYVEASARPAGARATTDGQSYVPVPIKRKVKRPDGQEGEVAVPVREYRALRWYPGELAAGRSLAFSARVRVTDDRRAPDATKGGGT